MEEISFNKTQVKQLTQVVTEVVTGVVTEVVVKVVKPMIDTAILASEKRLRTEIINQAELTKREIRDEFNQKLTGLESRLTREIRDFRVEVAERFSDTVHNRFDDHDVRLTRLEHKLAL